MGTVDGSDRFFLYARRGAARQASSLIELLVVIAIIGFLLSLLIPSLKRSTDMASATVCRHHLRELGRSLDMYRMENDGWLPVAAPVMSHQLRREEPEPWFGKLYPTYLPDPMVLRCPKDPFGYRLATVSSRIREPVVADFASYGLNNFIMTIGGGRLGQIDRNAPRRPLDTILAADLGPDNGETAVRSGTVPGPSRNDSLLQWSDGFDPFAETGISPWVTTRHGDGIHMLTLAGGVRDVRTKDILRTPIKKSYSRCAAGGCTLCIDLKVFHYSFAKDQLFWWTGPVPPD
jgi:type II secretory pathway pseudopilin PulG